MKLKTKIISLILIMTLLLSACALGLSVFAASPKGDINVWFIAGQSNAVGFGDLNAYPDDMAHFEDPRYKSGFEDVLIWRGDTAKEFVPVKIGQGLNSNCVGAEVGIASAVSKEGGKHAIIKMAFGNTNLYPKTYGTKKDDPSTTKNDIDTNYQYGTWTSPSYVAKYLTKGSGFTYDTFAEKSGRYDPTATITANNRFKGNKVIGNLFTTYIATVTTAVKNLRDQGYNPIVRGMWWMQGEAETWINFALGQADTSSTNANEIAQNLYWKLIYCLADDFRTEFTKIFGYDCSEMPFVLGRLVYGKDTPEGIEKGIPTTLSGIQKAQDQIASSPSIKNVNIINPAKYSGFAQQDQWHYRAPTQKWLGEQFVKAATGTKTKYGYIPTDYASTSSYPFAVFKNGKFIGAASSWSNKDTGALGLAQKNGDGSVILLRANHATVDKFSNLGIIKGTVTIDLNNYKLYPSADQTKHSTQAIFAADAKPSGTTLTETTLIIKNGTLEASSKTDSVYAPIINLHTWYNKGTSGTDDPYGDGSKTFNFVFENVKFVAKKSNAVLIASNFKCEEGLVEKKATANIILNNCTVDTNGKTGVTLVDEHRTDGPICGFNLTIIGGNIKTSSENNVKIFYPKDGHTDGLMFDRVKGGKYMTLTLSDTAEAPTATYTSVHEGSLSWNTADVESSGATKIYSMLASNPSASLEPDPVIPDPIPDPTPGGGDNPNVDPGAPVVPEIPDISRVPDSESGLKILTKVTFGKNLYFKIMFPADNVSEIKIDKLPVDMRQLKTEDIGGVTHLVVTRSLPASESLRDINLTITTEVSGETDENSYTLDVTDYAKAAITAADADEERKLIKEALSYIKAAYDYFDKTSAARIAEIDQLLGSAYNTANTPKWEETAVKPAEGNGVRGASLILGDEPAIRFYITGPARKYSFRAGARVLETKAGFDTVGNYVDVLLTAAEMNDTITFTIDGTSYSGSYNLKAYYNYIKSLPEVDPKLVTLVERIAAYAESSDVK